jgi:hypothetical protein
MALTDTFVKKTKHSRKLRPSKLVAEAEKLLD